MESAVAGAKEINGKKVEEYELYCAISQPPK